MQQYIWAWGRAGMLSKENTPRYYPNLHITFAVKVFVAITWVGFDPLGASV